MKRELAISSCIFLLSLLVFGCVSLVEGKELCWDLANYHYYNPYAFLHHRYDIDYWPVSFIHQYINPTIDFLTYYLINEFTPRAAEFILGALHGCNFWLLCLIALPFITGRHKILLALAIAGLGMYGPTVFPGIGSFQNDDLVSIFVLGFVCLLLRALRGQDSATRASRQTMILAAGLLAGISIALKLTAGIFFCGGMLAVCILPIRPAERIRLTLSLGLSMLAALLLVAGYWMLKLWQQHHNPLFPFLNGVFHSPDFDHANWLDMRFMPQTLWQKLFYPFYFSWNGQSTDELFQDFRYPVVYALLMMAAAKWIHSNWRNRHSKVRAGTDLPAIWIFGFYIFSYVIWQCLFSNSRYLTALEMLAPLMIYLLLRQVFSSGDMRMAFLIVIFTSIVYTMVPYHTVRAPWFDATFLDTHIPADISGKPQAMVLMAYPAYAQNLNPRPQSYLIPFFPESWRFIGIPMLNEKYSADAATTRKIYSLIHNYPYQFYLLTSDQDMPELYRIAAAFGLSADGACADIVSDRQKVSNQRALICPVRRSAGGALTQMQAQNTHEKAGEHQLHANN